MTQALLPTDEDEQVLCSMIEFATTSNAGDWQDGDTPDPAFASLLEQFARFATGDDYLWTHPNLLFERAASVWRAGERRQSGHSLIDLSVAKQDRELDDTAQSNNDGESGNQRLVLKLITDDKPFVVDSVTAAITDAGKSIHFFVNAIIDVPRSKDGLRTHASSNTGTPMRESVIYAELDAPIDSEEIEIIEKELARVLSDVEAAVKDWQAMRMRMEAAVVRLRYLKLANISDGDLAETRDFLSWVLNDHFAFLGVRRYRATTRDGQFVFERDPSGDLGTLKDSSRRILKNTYSASGELSPAVEDFLRADEPLLIAKANAKSIVHRRTYHDYLGVKLYDDDGNVVGEDRFIGLFTADAYNRPASEIPLLRAKVRNIVDASPFVAGGHNEKALLNILETYPRDELFQVDIPTLRESCIQILRLYKRPRVKLIMRRDRFDRFISAFVFIPRDVFNSDRRHAIGELLASAFKGRVSAFYPYFGDASLVRVHFIIGIDEGAPAGPGITHLTQRIRAICRDWDDDLLAKMRNTSRKALPRILFDKYRNAFDAGYRDHTDADHALADIDVLETMADAPRRVRAYRYHDDPETTFRLSLYLKDGPARLSDLIPTLENFGLSVMTENAHFVKIPTQGGGDGIWIHDFKTETQKCYAIDFQRTKEIFESAMDAILAGDSEDDGFNRLVIAAGLNWREAWFLRAAAKHHLQTGFSYSQAYIEETLTNHPSITLAIINAFHTRFDPHQSSDHDRQEMFDGQIIAILSSLDGVDSLDEDRILRRFVNLLMAMTRTNYYQSGNNKPFKPCLALKIDSNKLEEIPNPKPYREIFVSGPAIDGVHLRFGPVARGGLRWSDRKEDFRTEVLGLVKAQRVKNAVIVPNGAKGGFYPKQLPVSDDRNVVYEAGREAYKHFIRSLLDVTDNIVEGTIVRPDNIVSHDGDDPYLVVAADKGTAQFSDTANAISDEYGFWLGDAFASGGSVGYDHKAMGITARGAWEAVKRHFREAGKDIQTEPFTVMGVGDMSGDVFGNGMLLSRQICLLAAFDHRDIFIDPNPNPEQSFKERQRLFNLPRSSWQDYDKKLISKGGGVFARSAKSIPLSPQIKACLNISEDKLSPSELLNAILKAPCELFWLGGIGTYFKADQEENWRVGDRTNDAIRISASQMNMKVIGEGANLGLTQQARIEFAKLGGRINTDAIDNSAGVDSSDHEVNIKILLREAIQHGNLDSAARDGLLAAMTDDVATLVLHHNYEQTRALTLAHTTNVADLDSHHRFIQFLESQNRLDRQVEDLPSNEALVGMIRERKGLTRPELAVLLAYSKLWLFDELVESKVPDDPIFERELKAYFPAALRDFDAALGEHRLRREIIATRLCNEIVDTCGISFIHDVMVGTGASVEEIVLSYEAARRIFNLRTFAERLNALDTQLPASTQTKLFMDASRLLQEQTFRLVTDIPSLDLLTAQGTRGLISHYADDTAIVKQAFSVIAPSALADAIDERSQGWIQEGVPSDLAREAALFPALERALDIVDTGREAKCPPDIAGSIFFATGRRLQLEKLRANVRQHRAADHFDKRAIRRLMEEITRQQRLLTLHLFESASLSAGEMGADRSLDALHDWENRHKHAFERYDRFMEEVDPGANTALSVSQISLINRQLIELNERLASA